MQGTFRSLLWHHSLKASILWHSAFFTVQFSQPYMTTGKTIALSIWTFVSRVMSLLCNTLSRFIVAFLPRSNCLLISWLQSLSTVILEPKKRKEEEICHDFLLFSFYLPCSNRVRCHDLSFLILSLKWVLSLFSFTFIKRRFSSSLLSAIRVVSFDFLRLFMLLSPILILGCNSWSPAFLIMYSAG